MNEVTEMSISSVEIVVTATSGDESTDQEETTPTIANYRSLPKDRWGFMNCDDFHKFLALPPEVIEERKEKESDRLKKWIKMKKNWLKYCNTGAKYFKLKRRSRKGIPDAMRGFAWYEVCGAKNSKLLYPNLSLIDVGSVNATCVDEVSFIQCE